MDIEQKLQSLGLTLPPPTVSAPGVHWPVSRTRVFGNRVYIAGQGPRNPDGTAFKAGKVGADLTLEEGYLAARYAGLAILSSLKQKLDDLERVEAWLIAWGFVNVAPGFVQTSNVINGFSDLILELYGPDRGEHARTALGAAQLPNGTPVIIAAEVAIRI